MNRLREAGTTIGVIGAGNMGSALVKGWLRADAGQLSLPKSEAAAPGRGEGRANSGLGPVVLVWDKLDASVQRLLEGLAPRLESSGPPLGRLFAAGSLEDLVTKANVVVVVIKPKDARGLLADVRRLIRKEQVVVSAMAGLTLEWLRGALGPGPALFRIMPNLAVEVGAGAVALAAETGASPDSVGGMVTLLQPLGSIEVIAEELFDVVTAVSGSSPAFLALTIEALEDGAVAAGLTRAEARAVVRQAARLTAADLSDALDAPGESSRSLGREGKAGSDVSRLLEEREVRKTFQRATEAAMKRSRQMRES